MADILRIPSLGRAFNLKRCLVITSLLTTLGPKASGVDLLLPNPSISPSSSSFIFLYFRRDFISFSRALPISSLSS